MTRRLPVVAKLVVALLAAAIALAGCAPGGGEDRSESKSTPSSATASPQATEDGPQPVLDRNFPDPDILRVGKTYYAYATQPVDNTANVSMAVSADLTSWRSVDKDPLPELPLWAARGKTWAPEVFAVGKNFVMYFTARNIDFALQCIGVARATSADGPFRPIGEEPVVCPEDEGGAIDAASFRDSDGKLYLLWKNDGNCCGKDTWLYLQPLSANGLRLTGKPTKLINQTEGWEGHLIEAPTLVKHDSTYYLFYSANDYAGEKYATGYATAPKITGPYRKADEPLLTTSTVDVIGPGGQDIVELPNGETRIVFHGWDEAIVKRQMFVADLDWKDGRPVVDL